MEKTVTKGFWMLIAVSAIAILASPSISATRTISSIQKSVSALSIRAGGGPVGMQGIVRAVSLENPGVVRAVEGVPAHSYRIIEAQNILSVIDDNNALSQISSISDINTSIFPEGDRSRVKSNSISQAGGSGAITISSVIKDAKVIVPPSEGLRTIPEISRSGQINSIAAQIEAVRTTPTIMSLGYVGRQIQPKAIRADVSTVIAGIKSNDIAKIGSGSLYEIARIREGVLSYHNASIAAVSPIVNVINIRLIEGSGPAERGNTNLVRVGIGNSNMYGNGIVNGVYSSGIQIIGNKLLAQRAHESLETLLS
jgi:hypothetical protein